MRYSDYEQRQMDIASGEELDRHARRALAKRIDDAIMREAFPSLYAEPTAKPEPCPDCRRLMGLMYHCPKHTVS
jgi:hypothetical protein